MFKHNVAIHYRIKNPVLNTRQVTLVIGGKRNLIFFYHYNDKRMQVYSGTEAQLAEWISCVKQLDTLLCRVEVLSKDDADFYDAWKAAKLGRID